MQDESSAFFTERKLRILHDVGTLS